MPHLDHSVRLDFKDVLIRPKRSTIRSRADVSITIYGRFAYGSFRLQSVRLQLESTRLRFMCQFAYVLKHVLQQLIHLLYVRSRSDPSQSIQFLERDS